MMSAKRLGYLITLLLCFALPHFISCYTLVREYSGQSFFSGWDFYGNYDNTTLGNVFYLDQAAAMEQRLTYINDAGNAIIKVDNSSYVGYGGNRSSIRLTSTDAYDVGTLWIIDVAHIPYGCSVWPAIWSFEVGQGNWPGGGEIDIIEAINMMTNNQMALHTTPGCWKSTPQDQTGVTGPTDCSLPAGCVVSETKPNSWGSGFAAAGGGVFAAQLDVAGIFMWFWSRPNVPQSILEAGSTTSMNLSDWGDPSGSWPAYSCNISQYFAPQSLVIDITLCGVWAGVPSIYSSTCGSQGTCADVVAGNGTNFGDAYFEIPAIRAYSVLAPAPTGASGLAAPSGTSSASASSASSVTTRKPAASGKSSGQPVPQETIGFSTSSGQRVKIYRLSVWLILVIALTIFS